jgi:hypothetical protein
VNQLGAAHIAVAGAIAQREPPPPVRPPTSVERLDRWSRELAAHPPVDDPWAARGVVDILRTRALIAEIRISLMGLRNAFSDHADRDPHVELGEIDHEGVELVLPDEPYEFSADDGPECFTHVPTVLVSGRLLTWYGPSLVEAAHDLPAILRPRAQ